MGTTQAASKKKKAAVQKSARTSAAGLDTLRTQLRALKKLVLLQKSKQEFSGESRSAPPRWMPLLADYLGVILNLTGTTAGSILLRDNNDLVFRASKGPGSTALLGRRMPASEGIAGRVLATNKAYLSSDVSRDPRWSGWIGTELHFRTKNILASPLRSSDGAMGVVEIVNKGGKDPFARKTGNCSNPSRTSLPSMWPTPALLVESQREAGRRLMQMQLANVLNSTLDQREVRKRAHGGGHKPHGCRGRLAPPR